MFLILDEGVYQTKARSFPIKVKINLERLVMGGVTQKSEVVLLICIVRRFTH